MYERSYELRLLVIFLAMWPVKVLALRNKKRDILISFNEVIEEFYIYFGRHVKLAILKRVTL